VELRDTRLVDAQRLPDLLHRGVLEVVKQQELAVAGLEASHGGLETGTALTRDVPLVRRRRGRRHTPRGQIGIVAVTAAGGRRGFDGVDADDGAAEPLLVGAEMCGEIGQRRLHTVHHAQGLASSFEFTTDTAHAPWPRVATERVDHGAADAAFGEGLEADAATLVIAVHGVDQADHAVLY